MGPPSSGFYGPDTVCRFTGAAAAERRRAGRRRVAKGAAPYARGGLHFSNGQTWVERLAVACA